MLIKTFCGGFDRNFSYLLIDEKTNDACVIDPIISDELVSESKKYNLKFIINTHTDFDHVEGNSQFQVETLAFPKLKDNEIINLGQTKLKIIHTPGHTKDSICILQDKNLFTGDTLFVGGIGRVFYSETELMQSLKKLINLDEDIIIYPGHDYGQIKTSTIGWEKKTNVFLKELQ